jgi:hypothetical protein
MFRRQTTPFVVYDAKWASVIRDIARADSGGSKRVENGVVIIKCNFFALHHPVPKISGRFKAHPLQNSKVLVFNLVFITCFLKQVHSGIMQT